MGYRGLEASLVAQMVKNLTAMWGIQVNLRIGKIPWRRDWLSTPVLLPEESHGQRNLEGYGPRSHKELDMTEQLTRSHTHTGVGGTRLPYIRTLTIQN